MLLQCETEFGGAEPAPAWLRGETLESLTELNEETLELLAAQARATPDSAQLQQVAGLLQNLDAPGRRRAAACLYLLIDAGFSEPQCWRRAPPRRADPGEAAFFSVPGALPFAHGVFAFAWHLSRCHEPAARLLLGMPAEGVPLLARHTLREVRALADAQARWLRPRWWTRPGLWRELLRAAAGADDPALQRVRLHGQALLAAALYRGARARPAPGVGAPRVPATEPPRPPVRPAALARAAEARGP